MSLVKEAASLKRAQKDKEIGKLREKVDKLESFLEEKKGADKGAKRKAKST